MKNERQEKILAIIAASAIETQEQLIDSLRKEGISCTQATISRDIKQLHLIKEPTRQRHLPLRRFDAEDAPESG